MISISAQSAEKLVRLTEDKEAWLSGDHQKTLDILLAREKSGDLEINTLYNIGYLYFLQGQFSRSLLYLQTVIVRKPELVYPYLIISRIHQKIGNLYAARDLLERGLDEDSDNVQLLMEIARINTALEDINQAMRYYQNVLDEDEDNIEAISGLAGIYRKKGDFKSALELLADRPNVYAEATILLEKSKLAVAMGNQQEGRHYLEKLLLAYPNSKKWAGLKDTLLTQFNESDLPVPQPLPQYAYQIDVKEELDYKVIYGPMTLGWLKVRIKPPVIFDGKQVYPVIFFVDSNPSYGFIISLHHIYESYIDLETMNAVRSRLYTPGSDGYLVRVYNYDYDQNLFESYLIDGDGLFHFVQKDLPRQVQDATSILFLARGIVSEKLNGTTPVVIDEEFKIGQINFLNESETIEIGDQSYQTVKIFARIDFEGIAGMSGDGWGWFTADSQAKPIKGKFEIIVGSIIIEADPDKTELPDFHLQEE